MTARHDHIPDNIDVDNDIVQEYMQNSECNVLLCLNFERENFHNSC